MPTEEGQEPVNDVGGGKQVFDRRSEFVEALTPGGERNRAMDLLHVRVASLGAGTRRISGAS